MSARAEALAYASVLNPGDVIHELTDGPEIEAYRAWIPSALARRGLHLEPAPGVGWTVRETKRPDCGRCGGDWFNCACVNSWIR